MKSNLQIFHILLILFAFFFGLKGISQTTYYYNDSGAVQVEIDHQSAFIVVEDSFDENQLTTANVTWNSFETQSIKSDGNIEKCSRIIFNETISDSTVYQNKLSSLSSLNNVKGIYPAVIKDQTSFGTNDLFAVKTKQPTDSLLLQNFAFQNNSSIISSVPYSENWYYLQIDANSGFNAIELTNTFLESNLFDSVDPLLIGILDPGYEESVASTQYQLDNCRTNLPNTTLQWNLFNDSDIPLRDINVCDAWDLGLFGGGVEVAVIDTGLKAGIDEVSAVANIPTAGPWDFNYYYSAYGQAPHGTAVSTILAGEHGNGSKIAGVAPNAAIYNVGNKLETNFIQSQIASGINQALQQSNGSLELISMSFASNYTSADSMLQQAFQNAVNNNVILVAGAGSDSATQGLWFPANHPLIFSVSSSNQSGEWGGDRFGNILDVVAPGEDIPTINLTDIVVTPSGSSTATPQVTGSFALMKQANNSLDAETYKTVMKRTAQKSGNGMLITLIDDDPIFYSGLTPFNGPTGTRNDVMGNGVINASAAAKTVQSFDMANIDLHIRNSESDFGTEPDNVTRHANFVLWDSPDIWVSNDIFQGYDTQFHENPEYVDQNSVAYIFVKIINKSNTPYTIPMSVQLYWNKTCRDKKWPDAWNGALNNNYDHDIGGLIDTQEIPLNYNGKEVLKPGEQFILVFPWSVPNPADYVGGSFQDFNPHEFSFLARIVPTVDDPMYISEGPGVWTNVKNNNNIAWKNVLVCTPSDCSFLSATVSNSTNESKTYTLELFSESSEGGKSFYQEADVYAVLDQNLDLSWQNNGGSYSNAIYEAGKFKVVSDTMKLNQITLQPGQSGTVNVNYNFLADELTSKTKYKYHIIQRDDFDDEIINNITYYIKKHNLEGFDADAGSDRTINLSESTNLSAASIDGQAIYNWYDPAGNLIYSGTEIDVSPEITSTYKLEVINEQGVKDYDEVTISVNPFYFVGMSPNPANDVLVLQYQADGASSSYFQILEYNTGNTFNYIMDCSLDTATIDLTNYSVGLYFVTFVVDGNTIETKQLVKN